jgi:uncharacterized membrane protein YjjP (DUF1212 family)
MTTDLNLNQADCIHSVSNWGETIYQNICSGTFSVVQWGTLDYFLTIFVFGIFTFLFIVIASIIKQDFFY